MDGVHDMGGMHGFGPVQHEENEPVFHEPWEGRVYAMGGGAVDLTLSGSISQSETCLSVGLM